MIPPSLHASILEVSGAASIQSIEPVQTLWSGYGEIARVHLVGSDTPSLIVKWVDPPVAVDHPRGWSTNRSHQRKLRSYQVESRWYTGFSDRLDERCRVARCFHATAKDNQHLFLLEDLDAVGFAGRRSRLDKTGVQSVLTWLAHFHATFIGCEPDGLWPVGTYWHLETRPDELAAIDGSQVIKQFAGLFDQALSTCAIQTLVHGDAKVANFCFLKDALGHGQVAGVDFQYVGGGCGMKDVAYLLGSCLSEDECDRDAETHLDFYFTKLSKALSDNPSSKHTGTQVESAWRPLYPIAWADFHRFLLGWCPGHQKLHAYTHRMTEDAIKLLK
jgi:hypothetical protein